MNWSKLTEATKALVHQEYDMYQIEDGITLPPLTRNRASQGSKYPLLEMQVGQSFFVSADGVELDKLSNRLRGACTKAQTDYAVKYSVRTTQKDGVDGVRVWRVE
jgi:hypothetical protein